MTTVNQGDSAHDPEDAPFAQPQQEGDDRASTPLTPSVITRLLELPHEWLNLARTIEDARNVLVDAFARQTWSNTAPISNVAQVGTIAGNAYILAYAGHPSEAVELRDALVGVSAACTVTLVAARSTLLVGANPPYRQIGTVRATANALSVWFPAVIRLEPEENLFFIASIAAVNFDMSASYRILRG